MASLEEQFYKGNYNVILNDTFDSGMLGVEIKEIPFIIGSLAFKGRVQEGEHLFQNFSEKMDALDAAISRFFLGVNFCRKSDYKKSLFYFNENQNVLDGKSLDDLRFYFFVYQGWAFYYAALLEKKLALEFVDKAYSYAIQANFLYGRVLTSDLYAHMLIQPGQINKARSIFKEALTLSQNLGNGGIQQALEVSYYIHNAAHGFHPHSDLSKLLALREKLFDQDGYIQIRILFEISKQYELRGNIETAIKYLDEASHLTYSLQSKWYSIRLNLRYAHIHFSKGDSLLALNMISSSLREIGEDEEKLLRLEASGLEYKILSSMESTKDYVIQEKKDALLKRSKSILCSKNIRILNRTGDFETQNIESIANDDPLGNLIDLSLDPSKNNNIIDTVIDLGYLSLLRNIFKIKNDQSVIVIGLKTRHLIAFSKGAVQCSKGGSTKLTNSILKKLSANASSKNDLIQEVWGYEYQSLRHDQLIYRTINRLRNHLGPFSEWIEMNEHGYKIKDGVSLIYYGKDEVYLERQTNGTITIEDNDINQLNQRQLQALSYIKENQFINVKTHKTIYNISEITARRDLSSLYKLNLVKRIGKGRATSYTMI